MDTYFGPLSAAITNQYFVHRISGVVEVPDIVIHNNYSPSVVSKLTSEHDDGIGEIAPEQTVKQIDPLNDAPTVELDLRRFFQETLAGLALTRNAETDTTMTKDTTKKLNLLAIDPGETLGWCAFYDDRPTAWGQIDWFDIATLQQLVHSNSFDIMVVERYSLYKDKAAAQVNSTLSTVQVVGMLRVLAFQNGIVFETQPANVIHSGGKLIPPIEKLVAEHLPPAYKNRHARDAMAHGFAWLRKHQIDY